MAQHIPRLLTTEELQAGGSVTLTDEDRLHHLRNVLRINAGDELRLFNAQSGEWQATVSEVGKKSVSLKIGIQIHAAPAADKQIIHLAFAPLKRSHTEWMLEKVAELGVHNVIPVLTEYTQVRSLNDDRLKAIMVDAIEQCGSFAAPALQPVVTLATFLKTWNASIPLYTALEGERGSNPVFVSDASAPAIGILIGPEGGWSEDETALLKKQSFIRPVSLGKNVLRAETAAIAACAIARIRQ